MARPRIAATATRLRDGRVLVAAGATTFVALASAEVFAGR